MPARLLLSLAATAVTRGTATEQPRHSAPPLNAGLRVSADGRHLEDAAGRPFFWLGDTAWELLHRADADEAAAYLSDRAAKGFNVILTVVLAEQNGLTAPNAQGHLPLIDEDPTRPNEAYFLHVDHVIAKARALGLHVGLLPTWGDKFNRRWGIGPEVFTPANARTYGAWLAARYRDAPVIWILGGDRLPDQPVHTEIIDAMAAGIRSIAGDRQLITYHPWGERSSSEVFHDRPWLDFNLFQSGHARRDGLNFEMTRRDRALTPAKPVIDGEPCYEDHPVNWKRGPGDEWFGEFEVRRAAYWSLLAGAAGHTYGNHNLWQLWQPGRAPISHARTPWRQALEHPGASQMGIMRRLFETRPWTRLRPRDDVLGDLPAAPEATVLAAVDADGRFVLVYTPFGHAFSLARSALAGTPLKAQWIDPRRGAHHEISLSETSEAALAFDPPGEPARGNDWVLAVESVAP
ncbi:MAG TPA: DUF4038 domain-containing protein [Opitutaceae bacterium]